MKGYMLVIPADLSLDCVKTELDAVPKLGTLHRMVGGHIEAVPYFEEFVGVKERHPAVMFCHEEGKLKGKQFNLRADCIWKASQAARFHGVIVDDILVGDCVMLWGDPEFMDAI